MTSGINPLTGKSYKFKDRAGTRNGRLLFIKSIGKSVHNHTLWEAQCDCGNKKIVCTPNTTKSCGCLHKEIAAATQRAKALPPEIKRQRTIENRKKQRNRRKNCPVRGMQSRLSRLHRHALKKIGSLKTSPTFLQLGYTVNDFVEHIEKQFLKGMTWNNMNLWQIDHIIPISSAKTIEDVIALNQLSNLRPMWAKENNKKKNKREFLI
jgi:hypothetical protein